MRKTAYSGKNNLKNEIDIENKKWNNESKVKLIRVLRDDVVSLSPVKISFVSSTVGSLIKIDWNLLSYRRRKY